jgi:hypothetical protein
MVNWSNKGSGAGLSLSQHNTTLDQSRCVPTIELADDRANLSQVSANQRPLEEVTFQNRKYAWKLILITSEREITLRQFRVVEPDLMSSQGYGVPHNFPALERTRHINMFGVNPLLWHGSGHWGISRVGVDHGAFPIEKLLQG